MKPIVKKIILFVIIGTVLFGAAAYVLYPRYDDGVLPLKNFYKEPSNTVDVMVYGTSHVFSNINPAVMWEEDGIAAYCLSGSMQPMWNTYFMVKESLKYQTPRLIVVDVFSQTFTDEYAPAAVTIKNTFAMKPSKLKREAIRTSVPEENRTDYYLGFPLYHSSYNGLRKKEIASIFGRGADIIKGYLPKTGSERLEPPERKAVYEKGAIFEKEKDYLVKILELAEENNIPVLLIAAPYVCGAEDMRIYNTVSAVSGEYKAAFINYNTIYEKIGLDYSRDFIDREHTNITGGEKITRHLSKYIRNNYDIPDRRGDALYSSWDEAAELWNAIKNKNKG